jgi:zinc transport system substrate-binding protein
MKIIFMQIPSERRLRVVGLAVALLAASACGVSSSGAESGTGQRAQLRVVTAFYPLQFVAERVSAGHAAVSTLTQPGVEPHDLELTARQVGSISTADLVVYERTFQPVVDEAVLQSGNQHVLDTTTVVPLTNYVPTAGGQGATDASFPEHGGLDPHFWLDPTNLSAVATAVAERLATLDPDRAADYRARAATLIAELGGVDRSYRVGLANCRRTAFITTHAAFGYLAHRYGLSQIGINGISPDTESSPARIAEMHREATRLQVTTIFYETLVSPAVARSIAGDLGLATDVLDPLEGITGQSRGSDYLAVMAANLTALRKANSCR